jgi:hypothetical protein
MSRVELFWNGEKWIVKGDKRRLCEFVDLKCQMCFMNGHSCLTPDPEVCPSHSKNLRERLGDSFVNKLLQNQKKLKTSKWSLNCEKRFLIRPSRPTPRRRVGGRSIG